jgi:hypothetical protein
MWNERKESFVLLKVCGDDLTSIEHCLIYDLGEGESWLIEDDDLAAAIMSQMKEAGVPIVSKDRIPKRATQRGLWVEEMVKAGKSPSEINAALKSREHLK